MDLYGVPAYGIQLAELLAGVLKLDGHLAADPKDLSELLAAAKGAIAAGTPGPTTTGAVKSYVHTVPDHCDRVIWRGNYIGLASRGMPAPTPVFVVQLSGGTILKTSGTQAAHIIFIDEDIEGGDPDEVAEVLGQDYCVTQCDAETGPASTDLVDQVLSDLQDAHNGCGANCG
jgi:hypothetical protein